jgi:hypothetical protein
MKKRIQIFFSVFFLYGNMFTVVNAQAIPKVEKIDIFVSNLIVKDSSFLHGLDTLIFNSICTEIKDISNLKIFNVYSKKNNQQEDSYRLIISLDARVQIYNENDIKGCFNYNGYLFLWFYDIPKELLDISNQKRKLTYIKGVPHSISSYAEFTFYYIRGYLTLTGICCN